MDNRRSSLQNGRQERKRASSPYARPASPATRAPAATPSRLGAMLSYFSPFRSSKAAKQPSPEPEEEEQDEDEPAEAEDEEEGAFALHGQSLAHVGDASFGEHELDGRAPPSPTPQSQSLYPSLSSLTTSQSLPNLASPAVASPSQRGLNHYAPSPLGRPVEDARPATPSAWGGSEAQYENDSNRSPPGRATAELARFFREKADRGDEPLTAIEQAGVFALMQQAQAESLPTAFTPRFEGRGSSSVSTQGFLPHSASQTFPASTSTARFGSPAPSASSNAPFRRRRPVYVGAGYSSQAARRRKANAAAANGEGGLTRSQSVGMVYEMSGSKTEEPSVADGKRRKVVEDSDDAPPPFATEAPIPSSPAPSVAPSPAKAPVSLGPKYSAISTPARPSPLWQVSKADTPSPSPPKRMTTASSTIKPSFAADLMMDIIREEDAARPKVTRQEVLNPYESADNPMARIPRSRPSRPATPRRTPASAKKAAPTPTKEISPLEQLERTMPADYRRDDAKRARPSPASPAKAAPSPAPAPAKAKAKAAPSKKQALETIELLSDSDEEEQEEDEDEEEEEEAAPPPPKQTAHKSRGSTKQASTFAPAKTTSKAPTPSPAPPTPKRKAPTPEPESEPTTSRRPSLFAPPVEQPSSPKASLPPTPPPVVTSSFSFSVPPTAPAAAPSATGSDDKAREEALKVVKSALPKFSFAGAFVGCESRKEEDAAVRAVQELVKGMSRSELPKLAL
ncbi:hypothetical protein BCR35DRAFT_307947 [Leucosporidium creatinivorum]|uniref:Uncharacterized protein n=1 Tax=Leucosporidium creatinivorum TaxID=106004 RepID=A0A1Y2EGD7_9BASI|nr:hypothetical protein BCR35DRAFT_307947 [Leucosporidium creatinivorum]